jgi:hypothetical protein
MRSEHIPKACYSRIYLSVFKKIFPESDGKSFDNIWTKEIQSLLFGIAKENPWTVENFKICSR